VRVKTCVMSLYVREHIHPYLHNKPVFREHNQHVSMCVYVYFCVGVCVYVRACVCAYVCVCVRRCKECVGSGVCVHRRRPDHCTDKQCIRACNGKSQICAPEPSQIRCKDCNSPCKRLSFDLLTTVKSRTQTSMTCTCNNNMPCPLHLIMPSPSWQSGCGQCTWYGNPLPLARQGLFNDRYITLNNSPVLALHVCRSEAGNRNFW
jgi:hypothetical protein